MPRRVDWTENVFTYEPPPGNALAEPEAIPTPIESNALTGGVPVNGGAVPVDPVVAPVTPSVAPDVPDMANIEWDMPVQQRPFQLRSRELGNWPPSALPVLEPYSQPEADLPPSEALPEAAPTTAMPDKYTALYPQFALADSFAQSASNPDEALRWNAYKDRLKKNHDKQQTDSTSETLTAAMELGPFWQQADLLTGGPLMQGYLHGEPQQMETPYGEVGISGPSSTLGDVAADFASHGQPAGTPMVTAESFPEAIPGGISPELARGMTENAVDLAAYPLAGKLAAEAGRGLVRGVPAVGRELTAAYQASPELSSQAGWIAHHGTPHKWAPEPGFPHGRPRLDKIGTGEGAAVKGWGWYSADMEDVGIGYRDTLGPAKAGQATIWTADGERIVEIATKIGVSEQDANRLINARMMTGNWIQAKGALRKNGLWTEDMGKLSDALWGKKLKDDYSGLGHLYTLDIPDDIAPKLLDWDLPLNEQSKEVKAALRGNQDEWMQKLQPGWRKDPTGAQIYDSISTLLDTKGDWGINKKAASEYLASIGIPGNKYLDQMSRGEGKGTYNYVIWDQPTLDRVVPLKVNEKATGLKPAAQEMAGLKAGDVGAPEVLYHATTSDAAEKISKWGELEPRIGPFVKSTDAYQGSPKSSRKPLSFLSEEPEAWLRTMVGRKVKKSPADVTIDDIRKHGALVVVENNPSIVRHVGDGKIQDISGKTTDFEQSSLYEHPYFSSRGEEPGFTSLPGYAETGDYISNKPQEVQKLLRGDELVDFIEKRNPLRPGDITTPRITHFRHKDGKGLLDRSAWDLSRLSEKEELELPELLDYGLEQPRDVPPGSKFYFTDEGLQKHKELIRIMRKASKTGLTKETSVLSGDPVWKSSDGQVAIAKTLKPGDISTPEFREWSGGAPVIQDATKHEFKTGDSGVVKLYHGTSAPEDFEQFSVGDIGFHFGSKEQASQRAEDTRYQNGRPIKGRNPRIIPAYVKFNKLLRLPDVTNWGFPTWISDELVKRGMIDEAEAARIAKIADYDGELSELKRKIKLFGYDGIVYRNLHEGLQASSKDWQDSFIAFEPTQIKSIWNKGSWSKTDPRILYGAGAGVAAGAASQAQERPDPNNIEWEQ